MRLRLALALVAAVGVAVDGSHVLRVVTGMGRETYARLANVGFVVVILVSLVAFSLLGRLDPLATVASRVVGIPLVAGISYEILRLLGRYRNNRIAGALAAPGLAVQRITTPHIPLPAADLLEDNTVPSVERIVREIRAKMG